jgi:enoyl-CoA hydratase/carnithine racemase
MWRAIASFASEATTRTDIRYVIVRGDGNAFSAGADINDFKTMRASTGNTRSYDDLVEDTCRRIEAIDKPTIAAVTGPCMGAGLSLAASCDLRIAADSAFFAMPAAKIGLGYDPRGIARLLRVFGADVTRELIFTGERFPAQRAWQLGVVSLLFPVEGADDACIGFARRIASNAPLTIKAAKAAIYGHRTNDTDALLEADRLYAAADASTDYAEGLKAFAEKRQPHFVGR